METKPGNKRPLLGLCPIGKFVFSNEDAVKYKKRLQALLGEWNVDFVDLEGVLEDGLVKDQSHVSAVVEHFRAAKIDCLFMPHCNFGTEGAVGMIAKKLDVPVLLWGPRDAAPLEDGTRLRDSLCGLFASSKVLHKLGVKYSYIENCRVDDPQLKQGVDTFLGAVNCANTFRKGIRIGHIGQRIDFFWTTIINESELLERFNVQILPIDMVTFIEDVKSRVKTNALTYRDEAQELKQSWEITGFETDDPLMNILAVRDQMLEWAQKEGLDGFAVQDFTSLVDAMGTYCIAATSMVNDSIPVSMESDIHGALSSILLYRAGLGRESAFLSDIAVRHPEDDNGVLLWHAGAPTSMLKPGETIKLGHHWILPSPLAGMTHFPLKEGDITVARFDGDRGDYKLAVGEGCSMDGPYNQNNYLWMKVDNWPRWERKLIEGPFIHHAAMTYGHLGGTLIEACKFIDGLEVVNLDSED
ncbi:MAG: fucose isomerase [Kiritimatiellae bacterium]|jgi:L-fucose isomerase-like protein|nr:fucose isomerase [Kiritimatiellia bacterium]